MTSPAVSTAWTIQVIDVVLPTATIHAMCSRSTRRGGATATFIQRGDRGARVLVWASPDERGGSRPLGAFSVRYDKPSSNEATLHEVSWPPAAPPTELWLAVEQPTGRPIPR
jgi:hypothetical protein